MMYEVELWQKYGGDKILCAGVIDVKGRSLEPVEVVADRIRTLSALLRAGEAVGRARLRLQPDRALVGRGEDEGDGAGGEDGA